MKRLSRNLWSPVLLAVACILLGAEAAIAQPGVSSVVYHQSNKTVSVVFNDTLAEKIQNGDWAVVNLTAVANNGQPGAAAAQSGRSASPVIEEFAPVNTQVGIISADWQPVPGGTGYASVRLHLNQSLNQPSAYLLIAFNRGDPKKSLITPIDTSQAAAPSGVNPQAVIERVPGRFTATVTTSREDSNIYLAGAIDGAKHSSATKSIDAKLSFQYVLRQDHPELDLIPYVDLKTSSNIKANADTLKFGLISRLSDYPWIYDFEGRAEGDTLFRNVNVIGAFRVTNIRLARDLGPSASVYFKPMAGVELGRNVRRPVDLDVHRGIARGVLGATAYLNIFRLKKGKDTHEVFLSLIGEYTRRWPLLSELIYKKDASGHLIPNGFGTNPKDYLQAKVIYSLTPQFGLALGFDYGQLPPSYIKVDQKYSVSLVFKTGLKYSPAQAPKN